MPIVKASKPLHGKTPDDAESIGVAQQLNVAAGKHDSGYLERHDHCNDARGGAEFPMRHAEPVGQNPIFGNPVQYAIGADDGRVHGPGKYAGPDDHDEAMKQEAQRKPSYDIHCQSADQVVTILGDSLVVGNQHDGKKGHERGKQYAVNEYDQPCALQVLQLWGCNLPVHLRQAFLPAHRENRMSQPD